MNATQLIAKHLDGANLKIKVYEDIDAVCGFTGASISRGVLLKDLIKKTFTDHAYVRFGGLYASVPVAMCIESVYLAHKECVVSGLKISRGVTLGALCKAFGKGKVVDKLGVDSGYLSTSISTEYFGYSKDVEFLNALRNYSFLATEEEFRTLSRGDILAIVLDPPEVPFVLCVTYSNKKHIAFKSTVNHSNGIFDVYTDLGKVTLELGVVHRIYEVLKKWYCIVEGKEDSSVAPTYFTKNDILHGCMQYKKIVAYGLDKYIEEDEFLNQYRDTAALRLLTHILNKTTKND